MGVVMAKYLIFIRPDLTQVFWARMQAGDFISEAVALIETSRRTGRRILTDAGGIRPRRGRDLKGRCLTFAEREDIAVRRAMGQSLRQIGVAVGRSASTISRELRRNNVSGAGYRATTATAHALAFERASRPKPAKLHVNLQLRAKVERDLRKSGVVPKGSDLSIHSEEDLDWVAAELNDRPRKRLAFEKPIEMIEKLLLR